MAKSRAMKKPSSALVKKPAVVIKVSGKHARDGTVQRRRHEDIVVHLKTELAQWIAALEDSAKSGGVYECIICGRVCDRRRNMVRHAETHTTGKLSAMIGALESDRQMQHPVYMEVMRALYDNDLMMDKEPGAYAARVKALLTEWMQFSTSAADATSLFSALGPRDSAVVLVFTGKGPQYWARSDSRLPDAKSFANDRFYTLDFANMYARHLLQTGGMHLPGLRALRSAWRGEGCEVTQLALNRKSDVIANMSCDIMESAAMEAFKLKHQKILHKRQEYKSISIDATYKLALKVIGQIRTQKHNWVTFVGMRGSPLGIVSAYGEAPATLKATAEQAIPAFALEQVEQISTDYCSAKLFDVMRTLFPNLKMISQDAMHLCFTVDSHTKKRGVRPTVVGLVARSIMGKFNIPSPDMLDLEPYVGLLTPATTDAERVQIQHIKDGDLTMEQATDVIKAMDPNTPMKTLEEFAGLLAAVVVVYPEHMDKKRDKTTLRQSLVNATSPDRFQWLMNGIRYRSSIPASLEGYLAAGTTRNEQFHARLNSHYKQSTNISKYVIRQDRSDAVFRQDIT